MSRRRSIRLAPDVIDLVTSDSEEDEPVVPLRGGAATAPPPAPAPPTNEAGANQLPRSIPCSPISTATTTSNNPLANLLAASSKPGSARPPPSKTAPKPKPKKTTTVKNNNASTSNKEKSTGAGTSRTNGATKRKNVREKTIPEDADLDFIDSPTLLPQQGQGRKHQTALNGGSGGSNSINSASIDMWSLKYEPHVPTDLIIHKKKVEEVKVWLETHLHSLASSSATMGKMLVVTGPPGCGKTRTLRVLGESLGFSITEWQAQAEASDQEIRYLNNNNNTNSSYYAGGGGAGGGFSGGGNNSGSGYEERIQYVSKIAAFEEFTSRAKMPALPLSKPIANLAPSSPPPSSAAATAAADKNNSAPPCPPPPLRPTLVFIDDLPFTSRPEDRRRLATALANLAKCARFPIVLFATEASGRSQQDKTDRVAPGGLPKEISQALNAIPGVQTISFNAITPLNTAKVLREILKKEHRYSNFSESHVVALAEQAGGDLRNAINSLQFACTGLKPVQQVVKQPASKRQKGAAAAAGGASTSAKNKNKKSAAGNTRTTEDDVGTISFMLRDTSLSLFHGLGKLLYNKRLPIERQVPPSTSDQDVLDATTAAAVTTSSTATVVPCSAFFKRGPMDGFDPGDVLTASGLEATSVNAFLHENLPHFIQDSEIFDLAACLGELSTSDILSSTGRRRYNDSLNAGDDAPGGSTIADSCAAMVAARGVCFWNTHPAPRQWQPLRAPCLFTVHRGMLNNSEQLHDAAGVGRIVYGGSGGLDSAALLATELVPAVRGVCQQIRAPYTAPISLIYQQPAKWTRYWNGKLHESVFHAGVGARGAVIDVENAREHGSSGGGRALEEDPIEDSDDDN